MQHDRSNTSNDYSRLRSMIELSALINSSLDATEVRRMAVEEVPRCVQADAASLLLLDGETGELYFESVSGGKGSQLKHIRLKPGEGIAGWVVRKGGAVIVDDAPNDRRFASDIDKTTGYKTRNMIVAPVATKEKVWGVLQVLNKHEGLFTDEDLEIVEALANQVAIAIENAFIYQQLRATMLGLTTALAEALEKRDPYTAGHTRRVHEYSVAIARKLELPEDKVDTLRLASIMHDIGKIGVSDHVLRKPGRLDADEFIEMSKHPEAGTEILAHLSQLEDLLPGVLHHHEQFDGNGYPHKLSGKQIPLCARIIAVADAFDAMTSDRPYRKSLGFERAFAELKRCSGTQFDPEVVAAFTAAFENGDINSV